jgi:hypothetical protein
MIKLTKYTLMVKPSEDGATHVAPITSETGGLLYQKDENINPKDPTFIFVSDKGKVYVPESIVLDPGCRLVQQRDTGLSSKIKTHLEVLVNNRPI